MVGVGVAGPGLGLELELELELGLGFGGTPWTNAIIDGAAAQCIQAATLGAHAAALSTQASRPAHQGLRRLS